TGTTAGIARRIARVLGVSNDDIHDVAVTAPSVLGEYELDIIGSSTWNNGDVQPDFYDFLDGAQALDLRGHRIAIFGCGDESMSDSFNSAIGDIYKKLRDTGAVFVGEFNADGYDFDDSAAEINGHIVGLMLDEVNHADLTDSRIAAWVKTLKA
ncbi:MAG: flavodoxin domain-containing protein, partial [Muribaculaceae bacterium]|nr:flavodoxin domain-containing protein [Muribaculaceae bacterium]